jgi:hypothetical protein
MPSTRPRGAPVGNLNALKHGFYTRRLNKRDLSGVDSTGVKNLVDEIAVVRVFTRRLIEALDPAADAYEVAGALRILCVALTSITRAMLAQQYLDKNSGGMDDAISIAIREVYQELRGRNPGEKKQSSSASSLSSPPTASPAEPPPPTS